MRGWQGNQSQREENSLGTYLAFPSSIERENLFHDLETSEEVREPELKLQIPICFMNFKKYSYFNSEFIKTKSNTVASVLFGGFRDTRKIAQGLGNARLYIQRPMGWKGTK